MIRLTLVDDQGNVLAPEKLQTLAELNEARERDRELIRECDRLIQQKQPKKAGTGVPYA